MQALVSRCLDFEICALNENVFERITARVVVVCVIEFEFKFVSREC